jgi:Flp pilus assembly protein TadD
MRLPFTLLLAFAALALPAQHLTYAEWLSRAQVDMRLEPRYGYKPKNEAQRASDAEFVRLMLEQEPDRRKASGQLLLHGFDLLRQGEMPYAMFRFNQAWLLDSTNADAYWGFGTFFMELDKPSIAHQQYRQGLRLDSANVHLLTADAAASLYERGSTVLADPALAERHVQAALQQLLRAQALAPADPGVLYRLAVCRMLRGECDEAWRCYDACRIDPDAPIEAGFEEQLRAACPR